MKIRLVINTTIGYSQVTLPPLFESLETASFDLSDVIVISGGYDDVQQLSNNIYNVPYNSSDFTAFIALTEHDFSADFYFYLHDTCIVGPSFRTLLLSVDPGDYEVIALKQNPSMNIGLYSASYLKSKASAIRELKNTDYSVESLQNVKTWGVYNEDHLSWRQNQIQITSYSQLLSCPRNGEPEILSETDYYGNGVIRRLEYYKYLDLYKVKANWELRSSYEINP